jgi:transcriptional regulator with XRE-family HTH domain
MTGPELRAIRHSLGLSLVGMGRALGYQGTDKTLNAQVHKYECGERTIPPWIARLAAMYGRHGVPKEWAA